MSTRQIIIILTSIILYACSSIPKNKVVIRYLDRPFREFQIDDGTSFKINELETRLKGYCKENPNTIFDFVAEIKCQVETTTKIKSILNKVGVSLQGYWVPTSELTVVESPYGDGYINIKN